MMHCLFESRYLRFGKSTTAVSAMRLAVVWLAYCVAVCSETSVALGQSLDKILEEVGVSGSVLDEAPFDIITLNQEATGRSMRVLPIDFPNRRIPTAPKETDRLEVTLVIFPDRRYEVGWKDIGKVWLYEQMVLQQANKLVADKNFGEAFEHLNFLRTNYPQTPGLQTLRRDFLYKSAMEMAKQSRLPHTLAVLEELQRSFPDYEPEKVRAAISNISGQLIKSFFDANDLSTARSMVMRLENDYKKNPLPVVGEWKEKFLELATSYRNQAIEERDRGDFAKARANALKMLGVEPDIEGGREFLLDLIRAFPMIRVGVFQSTDEPDPASLADWPALRTGQLLTRPLYEFRSTGPEGGQYRFSLGNFVHSDDRTELEMTIQNAGQPGFPTSLDLSQAMLRRATVGDERYVPGWASIVDSVSVFGPEKMRLKMRRPHVLPQAFLQWQLPFIEGRTESIKSLYKLKTEESDRKRFEWAGTTELADFQPREIQEVFYTDPQKAIGDLVKGEIEFIDRLFPADARMLRSVRSVTLEEYALPMVHMIIPKKSNVYLDDREFRRALLYAINREGILTGEILGGSSSNVSRVISGPFPAGATENDPLAYAYNEGVETVAYDPRLAKVLVLLAKNKLLMMAEKRKEKLAPMPTFKLGVPNYEAARVAGEAIVQQWKMIDVPAELVILDKMPDPRKESPVDLLYVSAAIWEPATDAERLFGVGGPAQTNNQFIVQVLGQLSVAKNWKEVRQGCQDLHALVAAHLPILPLWQVGEKFAYRNEVIGVSKKPVGLYQDIQKWRYQLQK